MTKNSPFFECPRFKNCSVNNCPLHPAYPDLPIDPAYRESKCTMEKQVRTRIAAEFPGVLRYEGMTPKEYIARQRWERLSHEEKEVIRERARSLKQPKSTQIETPGQKKIEFTRRENPGLKQPVWVLLKSEGTV